MSLILSVIGLIVLLVVLYCVLTGTPMPKWLMAVLVGTAAIILLLCLMQEAGCAPPFDIARPH
jgi:hypothetical protein